MGDNQGISPLNTSGNMAKNWKLWKMRFENYMIAMELNQKDEALQCAQFLHYIGEDAFKIYTTFEFLHEEKNKLDVLMKKFDIHFLCNENLLYERYQFFTYRQSQEQTFEQFVSELEKKASKCELGELQDSLSKVMLICGVSSTDMRQRLLDDYTLEFNQAVQLCKVIEAEVTATESEMESCSSYQAESKQNVQNVSQFQNVPNTNAQKLPLPQPAEVNKLYKQTEIKQKDINIDVFSANVVDKEEVIVNLTTDPFANHNINSSSVLLTSNVDIETNDKNIRINEVATITSEPVKVLASKVDLSDTVKEEPTPSSVEGYYEVDKVVISSDNVVDKEEAIVNITANPSTNHSTNSSSVLLTDNATATSTDVNVDIDTNDKKIDINEVASITSEPVNVLAPEVDLSDTVKEEPTLSSLEGYYEEDKVVISSDNVIDKEEAIINMTTDPSTNHNTNSSSVLLTDNATAISTDVNVDIDTNDKKIDINEVAIITSEPVKVLALEVDLFDTVKEEPTSSNLEGCYEGDKVVIFSDNVVDKEEAIINMTTDPSTNHNTNSSLVLLTDNATATSTDANVDIDTNDKKIDINEVAIITSEPVKVLALEVDLFDTVKEEPTPSNLEGCYEGDKVVISSDNLLLVDKEATTKITSENSETEPKLIYPKMQWSPHNPAGIKRYERDFLMALRDTPASLRIPSRIPGYILADDRGVRNVDGMPSFQRGVPPKRKRPPKFTMPILMIGQEDVKLHESENPWRPARLVKNECATDDDRQTEELYKKVRSVLNKLTPLTFEMLVSQVKKLQIDTAERLQGVVDLFFEKTVYGPNFSYLPAYALMCKELALVKVPTSNSTEDKLEFVNFHKLLIGRCQEIFDRQFLDAESIMDEKLKEIEACTDSEKKEGLQFDLETYDRQLRIKSEINITFIGELFKQQMLTVNVMMRCLNNLLDNKDEESLECLCKLLTTIGKELEVSKNVSLISIFGTMKNIVDKKEGKVSSRIRFKLQDVIDLRNSSWKPRKQEDYLELQTIDRFQKKGGFIQQRDDRMKAILHKYAIGMYSEEDCLEYIPTIPSWNHPVMIEYSYHQALHMPKRNRQKITALCVKLLKTSKVQLDDYCAGLQRMQLAPKETLLFINMNIWEKLAEMLADLICEEVLPVGRLVSIFGQDSVKLLLPLFKLVTSKKGSDFLNNAWQASGLQLCDYMSTTELVSLIKDNQSLTCLLELTQKEIQAILLDFLMSKKSLDDVVNWITEHIGDNVNENKFIRALATAVFLDSINDDYELVPETLSAHNNLLFIYVDGNPTYELQCLYALQDLVHSLKHPPGLLLFICEKLYEMDTFSHESFISWEESMDPAEQQGKVVALLELTGFLNMLKRKAEEEHASSTSDDD